MIAIRDWPNDGRFSTATSMPSGPPTAVTPRCAAAGSAPKTNTMRPCTARPASSKRSLRAATCRISFVGRIEIERQYGRGPITSRSAGGWCRAAAPVPPPPPQPQGRRRSPAAAPVTSLGKERNKREDCAVCVSHREVGLCTSTPADEEEGVIALRGTVLLQFSRHRLVH